MFHIIQIRENYFKIGEHFANIICLLFRKITF